MLSQRLSLLLLAFSLFCGLYGSQPPAKILYKVSPEPIDVVIPCSPKDKETLNLAIKGIKKNGEKIRRVIVISKKKLTDKAEWFDEKKFPFTPEDIALALFHDQKRAKEYMKKPKNRIGWIYQQLLKLYSPYVIPNISTNVLILDADTIFLNPVQFLDSRGNGNFNTGEENHTPYFSHMKRLIPWMKRIYPQYSGISHHMLFQRAVLDDLFQTIRMYHHIEPWEAIVKCIDRRDFPSCLSEYEIVFNFVFLRSNQMHLRPLNWRNSDDLSQLKTYKKQGYHYVSFHAYMRESNPAVPAKKTAARCRQP